MIRFTEVKEGVLLKDYELYSTLAMPLRDLYMEAANLVPKLKGRKIWMVNSTSHGGGVAEMMPRIISLLRQLGVDCEWVVASTEIKEYYTTTKKIHNLIHGEGSVGFSIEEKEIYEKVNQENAIALLRFIKEDDIVVIHDPQPLALGYFLKNTIKVKLIWRCHIGHDKHIPSTALAWEFLKSYLNKYDLSVFSAIEYVPNYLSGRAVIMYPSIDPLDHKNRDLPIHKIVGIFCNSKLIPEYHPVLTPPFKETVQKLQPDGKFHSPIYPTDAGLLFKPTILQVSRWDRLKGFLPLLKGFKELKKNKTDYGRTDERHHKRLSLLQLVLAGPDPTFVEDDPEGKEVMNELCKYYEELPSNLQHDISILKLPMSNRKNNEVIVNALQRVSTLVVQNSIREGFGLTVTEAMWKIKPVIGSMASGIRHQIRDGIDGRLIQDPSDPKEIAEKLNQALAEPKIREVWGYSAQKKVIENFLIFNQLRKWLDILA
jgi:trehalose synthase